MADGRGLSRREMLVEVGAAADAAREVTSRGDRQMYEDDVIFRYAVAFACLRLAEPICRLITWRLVGADSWLAWAGICRVRSVLAHERYEDIDFDGLWTDMVSALARRAMELPPLGEGRA
jgi:uncharacterized protein with HEPN domain